MIPENPFICLSAVSILLVAYIYGGLRTVLRREHITRVRVGRTFQKRRYHGQAAVITGALSALWGIFALLTVISVNGRQFGALTLYLCGLAAYFMLCSIAVGAYLGTYRAKYLVEPTDDDKA